MLMTWQVPMPFAVLAILCEEPGGQDQHTLAANGKQQLAHGGSGYACADDGPVSDVL